VNAANPESATVDAHEATDWIGELLERAEAGDQTVLPKVREVLQSPEITDLLGNLARRVEVTIVAGATGGNLAMQEGLTKKLADMRAELCKVEAVPGESTRLVIHSQFAR
jgi:hypothetical protein